LGPIPNPQSPIPNPQSPIPIKNNIIFLKNKIKNNYKKINLIIILNIIINNLCIKINKLLYLDYFIYIHHG
jgi:hypothetical protein